MKCVESLNQALHHLFATDPRVLLLGEDLLDPYGGAFKVSKGLSSKYPGRVLTTPISEASIVGMGTGLALRGMRPVVEIMFGDFVLLAADQIVNSATKFPLMYNSKVRVPLVIRVPMGGGRGYGPTHSQTLESYFNSTPNLEIVAPSYLHDPGQMLERSVLSSDRVTLFVENKLLYSKELLDISHPHPIFHFRQLELDTAAMYPTIAATIRGVEKADLVVVAYGGMAEMALQAAERAFLEEEIAISCLIVSQVKPLPVQVLRPLCAAAGKVLIIEESVKYGGWGAELSAQLHEGRGRSASLLVRRLGLAEFILPSAKALEDKVLPLAQDVFLAAKELFYESR
jgi:pyruvate/2-oxoglutarate/acetoin dehydrogenase E1 component